MDNYFDSYERDSLYYAGKKFIVPQKWRTILDLYSQFLELNHGFINTRYTSDIILPPKLSDINFSVDIKKVIDLAIEKKDLSVLFSVDIFNENAWYTIIFYILYICELICVDDGRE